MQRFVATFPHIFRPAWPFRVEAVRLIFADGHRIAAFFFHPKIVTAWHVGVVFIAPQNTLQEIVRVPPLQVFQGRAPAQAPVRRRGVRSLPQRERPFAEVLLGQCQGE